MLGEHIGRFPSVDGHVFSSAEGMAPGVATSTAATTSPPSRERGSTPTYGSTTCGTRARPCSSPRALTRKEIAERLGHPTTRLTMDRYGHLLPSLDERLREGLGGDLSGGRRGTSADEDGTSIPK